MELTEFIEELLNVKLLDYQKIAINNFTKHINHDDSKAKIPPAPPQGPPLR